MLFAVFQVEYAPVAACCFGEHDVANLLLCSATNKLFASHCVKGGGHFPVKVLGNDNAQYVSEHKSCRDGSFGLERIGGLLIRLYKRIYPIIAFVRCAVHVFCTSDGSVQCSSAQIGSGFGAIRHERQPLALLRFQADVEHFALVE